MPADTVLRRLERSWADLHESFTGLTEAQLTQPGALGEWSVKDVLAHITTWEKEALKHLPTVARGERPPRYASEGGIDAFNARTAEANRQLSLATVQQNFDRTHANLVRFLKESPAENFTARFVKRLRLDTYGHYNLHAKAIREWRSRIA